MLIDVLTLFPEYFRTPLEVSMLKIAVETGLVEVELHDFRKYSSNKHSQVDDTPYGGGPGMILMLQPIVEALESLIDKRLREGIERTRLILLTPEGRQFDQEMALELSREEHLILVSGHYEGFDARLTKMFPFEEVSIGDYILSGGEAASLVIIEAVAREVPGVLGNPDSIESESFRTGLLDYPSYTRPPDFRGLKVPEILLGGNHKLIAEWRLKESLKRTMKLRPDLIDESKIDKVGKKLLKELEEELKDE